MGKTLTTQIKLRTDTYANWMQYDPVLEDKEACVVVEIPDGVLPGISAGATAMKVGDGTTKFSKLNFIFKQIQTSAFSTSNVLNETNDVSRPDNGLILTPVSNIYVEKILSDTEVTVYVDQQMPFAINNTFVFDKDDTFTERTITEINATTLPTVYKCKLSTPLDREYFLNDTVYPMYVFQTYLTQNSTISVGTKLYFDNHIKYNPHTKYGDFSGNLKLDDTDLSVYVYIQGTFDSTSNTVTVDYIDYINCDENTTFTTQSFSVINNYMPPEYPENDLVLAKDYKAGDTYVYFTTAPLLQNFDFYQDSGQVVSWTNEAPIEYSLVFTPVIQTGIDVVGSTLSRVLLQQPTYILNDLNFGYETTPIESGGSYWFGDAPKQNYIVKHKRQYVSGDVNKSYVPKIEVLQTLVTKGITSKPVGNGTNEFMTVLSGPTGYSSYKRLFFQTVIKNSPFSHPNYQVANIQELSSTQIVEEGESFVNQRQVKRVSVIKQLIKTGNSFLHNEVSASFYTTDKTTEKYYFVKDGEKNNNVANVPVRTHFHVSSQNIEFSNPNAKGDFGYVINGKFYDFKKLPFRDPGYPVVSNYFNPFVATLRSPEKSIDETDGKMKQNGSVTVYVGLPYMEGGYYGALFDGSDVWKEDGYGNRLLGETLHRSGGQSDFTGSEGKYAFTALKGQQNISVHYTISKTSSDFILTGFTYSEYQSSLDDHNNQAYIDISIT